MKELIALYHATLHNAIPVLYKGAFFPNGYRFEKHLKTEIPTKHRA